MCHKFMKTLFLVIFSLCNQYIDVKAASQFKQIVSQIGSNLTSLATLIGDPNITSLNDFPADLQSMPAFNFNFTSSPIDYNYSFISVSPWITVPAKKVQTALEGTSFAKFDWTSIFDVINKGGVYISLLAFDANNKFISALKGANVESIALVAYDGSGNLLPGMPLIFPAQNYTENSIGKTGPLSFGYNVDANHPLKFAMYNQTEVVLTQTIDNYPFLIEITTSTIAHALEARALELIRAVYQQEHVTIPTSVDGIITTESSALTAFYVWAPDTNQKAFVDVDFTWYNNQLLNLLNTALLTQDVYLNFVITPSTASVAASVTMQGYTSAGDFIPGLSYQATQGAVGQVLGSGYIRYSFKGSSDLIGLPVGSDFTAQQLSNLWIKVTQNIPVYLGLISLTLAQLQKLIPALVTNQANVTSYLSSWKSDLPGWGGSSQGWNLSLHQMNGGSGYAFVQDPWNNYITTQFDATAKTGVVTTKINVGSIESTISCKRYSGTDLRCDGECSMVLLAFDKNNNYMSNILNKQNKPSTFGLFMYDGNGNILPGFPVRFNPSNYVGLGSYSLASTQPPATFLLGGLGLSSGPTLTYPFTCVITWNYTEQQSSEQGD